MEDGEEDEAEEQTTVEVDEEGEDQPVTSKSASNRVSSTGQMAQRNSRSPAVVPTEDRQRTGQKRPARKDLYEVPSSPEGESVRVESTRKRPRLSAKAKKPIGEPKRSNGNAARSSSIRQFDTSTTTRPLQSSSVAAPRPAGETDPSASATTQPKKRGRGRPRKTDHVGHEVVPEAEEEEHGADPISEEEQAQHEEERVPDEDTGITDILMNPSPVKPVQQSSRVVSYIRKAAAVTHDEDPDLDGELSSKDDADASAEARGIAPSVSEHDQEGLEEPPSDNVLLIANDVLPNMIEIAGHVGYHYSKKGKEWNWVIDGPTKSTPHGKKIMNRLKSLLVAYKTVRDAKATREMATWKKARDSITGLIEDLQVETDEILSTQLGTLDSGFFNKKTTIEILTDLYFKVFPRFLEVIQLAFEAFPPERSIKSSAILQVLQVVTMLQDLTIRATLQEAQPRPESKHTTYQIKQPTRMIKEDIQHIVDALSGELAARDRIKKAAEGEKRRFAQAAKRKEQERLATEQNRLLRKERHRLQRESFQKRLHEDPNMGRMVMQALEKRKGRIAGEEARASTPRSQSRPVVNDSESDHDEDDPFVEEDVERISVFGTNNTNTDNKPKPISPEQMGVFIECMRLEQGK